MQCFSWEFGTMDMKKEWSPINDEMHALLSETRLIEQGKL